MGRKRLLPARAGLALLVAIGLSAGGPLKAGDQTTKQESYVPAKGLVAYARYEGISSHGDAWMKTSARELLTTAGVGPMFEEMIRQVFDWFFAADPSSKITGRGLVETGEQIGHHGFILAFHQLKKDTLTTIIIPGAGREERRDTLEKLLRANSNRGGKSDLRTRRIREREVTERVEQIMVAAPKPPAAPRSPDEEDDRAAEKTANPAADAARVAGESPWISWWYEGEDLVIILTSSGVSKGPSEAHSPGLAHRAIRGSVFDSIQGKVPNVTSHPSHSAARSEGDDLPGFVPNGLAFVEMGGAEPSFYLTSDIYKAILESLTTKSFREALMAREKELGLGGVRRAVCRWGFHGKALATCYRLEAPTPRHGLLALLDQPVLPPETLSGMPAETRSFVAGTLNPLAILSVAEKLAENIAGKSGAAFLQQGESLIREATGLRLREDLLGLLGGSWVLLRVPDGDRKRGEGENPIAGYALRVAVDDGKAVARTLSALADRFNALIRGAYAVQDEAHKGLPSPAVLAIEPLPAPEVGFLLSSPARLVGWLETNRPTFLIRGNTMVLASDPERARRAFHPKDGPVAGWKPEGEIAAALGLFPAKLTFFAVDDTPRSSLPRLIASLPRQAQDVVTLLTLMSGGGRWGVGLDQELGIAGIPGPNILRFRMEPSTFPREESVRGLLFPTTVAAGVDDRGFRVVVRESFPASLVLGHFLMESVVNVRQGAGRTFQFRFSAGE